MKKNEKQDKIDEFWNDCMNKPIITNNNKNSFSIPHNNKINNIELLHKNIRNKRNFFSKRKTYNIIPNFMETECIKSKLISTTQSSYNNLKNIQDALKREGDKPKRQEKMEQKFSELYNKNKKYKELLDRKNNSQRQIKEKLKLEECTFKPKKCRNKILEKKINKLYLDSNIYERNIRKQQQYNEKIALLFNEYNKIMNNHRSSECFFHPNICNNSNIGNILYSNIWKEQVNNDSNKLFLLRYMKAREKEYDKKEKINNPINKKCSYKNLYPKIIVRNLSEKDSLIMKKNLHKTLYEFNNMITDEDNNE